MSSVSPESSSSSSLPELPEQLCGALAQGFLNSSISSSRRLFARQESEKDVGREPNLERRWEANDKSVVELRSVTDLLRSLTFGLDQLLRRDLEEIWITLGAVLVFFLMAIERTQNKQWPTLFYILPYKQNVVPRNVNYVIMTSLWPTSVTTQY